MIRKRTLARECALQILYQWELSAGDLSSVVEAYWMEHADLPKEVREFADRLVEGASKNIEALDKIIMKATENWQLDRMAVIDRSILRFATFELLYAGDIPPKVTINEAVNIAKKFSQEESGKFVNGVLDRINHTEKPVEPKTTDHEQE